MPLRTPDRIRVLANPVLYVPLGLPLGMALLMLVWGLPLPYWPVLFAHPFIVLLAFRWRAGRLGREPEPAAKNKKKKRSMRRVWRGLEGPQRRTYLLLCGLSYAVAGVATSFVALAWTEALDYWTASLGFIFGAVIGNALLATMSFIQRAKLKEGLYAEMSVGGGVTMTLTLLVFGGLLGAPVGVLVFGLVCWPAFLLELIPGYATYPALVLSLVTAVVCFGVGALAAKFQVDVPGGGGSYAGSGVHSSQGGFDRSYSSYGSSSSSSDDE